MTEDATVTVLKYNLSRFLPLRIVLNNKNGKITGVTEESFSMETSERHVRIWWSGKSYSMLGERVLNAIDDAAFNARHPDDYAIDPFHPDCPVDIDWDSWVNASTKYDGRNAKFKLRDKRDE